MLYAAFFHSKKFLSEHLKISLPRLGSKKPLQPREPGETTKLAPEDKPAPSDGESEFSWRAQKQGTGCMDGGHIWSHRT